MVEKTEIFENHPKVIINLQSKGMDLVEVIFFFQFQLVNLSIEVHANNNT